jgi:DNA-binding MarR family transcriptional regulator
MLDRLEYAQLIVRHPNPIDHRGSLVTTTPNALQTIGPLFKTVSNAQAQLLAHYSEDDLALVGDFLRSLAEVWESCSRALPPFEP